MGIFTNGGATNINERTTELGSAWGSQALQCFSVGGSLYAGH